MPLVPGEDKLTGRFQQKLTDVAGRLEADPEDLLRVMSFETGGSFSPSERNQAGSGATGLIQFMPNTARNLGTTPESLAQMSPEQQLDVVEQYLTPFKGKLGSLKDTYLAVLYPKAVGQPDSTVLFTKGTKAYEQNAGLDAGEKGQITVGDVVSRVRRHLGLGAGVAEAGTLDQDIDREVAMARRQARDDLTPQYLAAKNTEIDAEIAAEIARARGPQPMEAGGTPGQGPGGRQPVPAGVDEALSARTPTPPGGEEAAPLSFGERLGHDALQVLGGVRDAFVNTMQSLNLLGDWMRDAGIGPSGTLEVELPEVAKANTVEGSIIRSASQFLVGFLPLTKMVKAVGVTGRITSGMLGGALTDFAAFDPQSPRMSNLIEKLPIDIRNPVTDYLAAQPDDSAAEGRFKNALEGLPLGLVGEGLFASVKALRQMYHVRHAVGDALPEGAVRATVLGDEAAGVARTGAQVTDEEIAQQLATRATVPTTVPVSEPTASRMGMTRRTTPVPGQGAVPEATIADAPVRAVADDGVGAVSIGPATREHAQQFQTLTASGAADALPTTGRVLHINFDKIQTGDDLKQTIVTVADVMKAETDVQRRGTMTVAETMRLAAQSEYRDLDRILGITPGTILNAEDATAVRQVWLASAGRFHELSQQLAAGDLRVADDWLKQFVLTANVQTKHAGVTAESGRSLHMLGVEMPTTEKHFLDNMAQALLGADPAHDLFQSVGAAGASQHAMHLAQQIAGLTTPQQFATAAMALQQQYTPQQLARLSQQQQLAAMLTQLHTPAQLATFMTQAQGITKADMFKELWYGARLSAPPLHVVNALDSALRLAWSIPERYLTTATGHPRDIAKNFHAANAYTFGLRHGLHESWQHAAKAWETGVSAFGQGTKVPYMPVPAFTAQNLGMAQGSVLYDYADLLGSAARLSGRFLMSTDEFFKALSYRMQLHEGAFRQATEEGLTGTPLAQRIHALTQTPTPELKERTTEWAQYLTLGQSLSQEGAAFESLGRFTDKLAEATEHWLPAKIAATFIRTPFNIARSGAERIPLIGNLSANVNRKLMAGGAEGALARSQMALGGMALATFAFLASEDMITGAPPADPGQRATWERLGKLPYSVRFPFTNKWIAYNRLDGVGIPMGMAADFVKIARDAPMQSLQHIGGAMLGAIFSNLTSKTWLKNVADTVDAFAPGRGEGPAENAQDFERYVKQLVGNVVPSGVALVARMVDPVQRETRSMLDMLLNRVPGMSPLAPAMLDRWGRIRMRNEPVGPDLLSPFLSRDYTPDPVDLELYRLGTPLRMPDRVVSIPRADRQGNETVELTPQQYHRLVKLSAGEGTDKTLKQAIGDLLETPAFRNTVLSDGPRGGKSMVILDLVQKYDEMGLAKLQQEDASLSDLLERKAITRGLMQTTEGNQQLQRMKLPVGGP